MNVRTFTRAISACVFLVLMVPGLVSAENNLEGYGAPLEEVYEIASIKVGLSSGGKSGLLYVSTCQSCPDKILLFDETLEIKKNGKISNDLRELENISRSATGVIFDPLTKTARMIMIY
ncbi:hypothetical protein [Litoribacillus peritrichatus]|uniref:Uncharacterized protein n=1 Tax=Litoribacillus peritrichatus TaxID=718191 RepID=A0ABP7MQ42_9GAMM